MLLDSNRNEPAASDLLVSSPPQPKGRGLPWPALCALGLLAALTGLGYLYLSTQHAVIVEIGGARLIHHTHQREPQAVLREMGIALNGGDVMVAPDAEALLRGEPIRLEIARPVQWVHDGSLTTLWTRAASVGEALAETEVALLPHDRLTHQGSDLALEDPLPQPMLFGEASPRERVAVLRQPLQIRLLRAMPLTVQDGAIPISFYTTAATVGEALYAQGLLVYAADRIYPGLESRLSPEMTVYIERAKPAILAVDGAQRQLRTQARSVGELLAEQHVFLDEKDYVLPALDTEITRDLRIEVVRVYDEYYVEETPIPFQTRLEPAPDMEIDLRETAEWGREGSLRKRVRVHYENGQEMHRVEEAEWVAREPMDRVIRYGTQIVLRELETPQGTITYWRKLRMLATSYNAPTAGKPLDHPQYGITRVGWQARYGIIAVDPQVISLYQNMYVPGYGLGVAGDTGSAIKGRRIDLCYGDDNLVLWYRWVDVYLLAPAPPASQINYSIPNTPRERE